MRGCAAAGSLTDGNSWRERSAAQTRAERGGGPAGLQPCVLEAGGRRRISGEGQREQDLPAFQICITAFYNISLDCLGLCLAATRLPQPQKKGEFSPLFRVQLRYPRLQAVCQLALTQVITRQLFAEAEVLKFIAV